MARKSEPELYEATETFMADVDGQIIRVEKGMTRVHRSSAVYKANPHFFKPLDVTPGVEAATAAPGEQRGEVK